MKQKYIYMLYPEGKQKALTLSYDDGVRQDERLVDILNRYGIKGTFNLCSGLLKGSGAANGPARIMSREDAVQLFKDSGHEVALHSLTHPWLDRLPSPMVYTEILEDRKNLETMFDSVIQGMAYPQGTYSNTVVEAARQCGIVYARTTVSTENFKLPADWLLLHPTCHHNNPCLFELAERFTCEQPAFEPWLFYLWGHSYEFDNDNNWGRIEQFCEAISGKSDIWYATNIEIYNYVQAWNRLVFTTAVNKVYNPSATAVWFMFNYNMICVEPGQMVSI